MDLTQVVLHVVYSLTYSSIRISLILVSTIVVQWNFPCMGICSSQRSRGGIVVRRI